MDESDSSRAARSAMEGCSRGGATGGEGRGVEGRSLLLWSRWIFTECTTASSSASASLLRERFLLASSSSSASRASD